MNRFFGVPPAGRKGTTGGHFPEESDLVAQRQRTRLFTGEVWRSIPTGVTHNASFLTKHYLTRVMKKFLFSAVLTVAAAGLFAQNTNATAKPEAPKPAVMQHTVTPKKAPTAPATGVAATATTPQQPVKPAATARTTEKPKTEPAKNPVAAASSAGNNTMKTKKHHRRHKKSTGATTPAATTPKKPSTGK